MQTQPVHTDLPIGVPIAVYRKPFNSFLSIGLPIAITVVMVIFSVSGALGNQASVYITIIGFSIILGLYFAWETSQSKVECYADAVVIYSPFQHQVFYF